MLTMSFCGSRQDLTYRGLLIQLDIDILAQVCRAIIMRCGARAAGRLLSTCKFFNLQEGRVCMMHSCQAAVAELEGVSQEDALVHKIPVHENWLRCAAICVADVYGRDDELLVLQTQRFLDMRNLLQQGSALDSMIFTNQDTRLYPYKPLSYKSKVLHLEAFLEKMRARHGKAAVRHSLMTAESREVNLLPDGFYLSAIDEASLHLHGSRFDKPVGCTGAWYEAYIPGLSGTLHDNSLMGVHIFVTDNYPCTSHSSNLTHELFCVRMVKGDLFHPNVHASGVIAFDGMEIMKTIWDASCSMSELLLYTCASIHLMSVDNPLLSLSHANYVLATQDRPRFRRQVRALALSTQASPRIQSTPIELLQAIFSPDPNRAFRSVRLGGNIHRIWWPRGGKWSPYTYPDDVSEEGFLKDCEGRHAGWI